MRNMSSDIFCVVCLEGMWMNLLSRLNLIDDLTVVPSDGSVTVTLKALLLGQLRPGGPLPGERYEVRWTQGTTVRSDLQNKFGWTLPRNEVTGQWSVHIQYITTEIRSDPRGFTTDTRSFRI